MRFVEDFVAYAQEFTGCPKPFLEWSAILCLSAVAGRKHVLRRGDWDVRPNLWVMLLGQSSSYKSTGLSIAKQLIREAIPEILLAQEYSSEKLLDDIQANPHRLFVYDEAESFFKMLEQSYNAPMKSALMTLYRDSWYIRRTKQGEVAIKDPYLCWGGASTPVQIAGQLTSKDTDLLSGMLPRFLLVPYFGVEQSIEDPPPYSREKRLVLVERLQRYVDRPEIEYRYSPEALAVKSDWLKRFEVRRGKVDSLLAAFYKKMKDEHFHKLAILSAFERSSAVIEPLDLDFVIPTVWQVEENLPMLVERLTSNEWNRQRQRIIVFLKKEQSVGRSELSRAVRIWGQHLEAHINGLLLDSIITTELVKGTTRSEQLIHWVG